MLIHLAHANGIPGSSYRPLYERLQPHTCFALERFGHDPRFPVDDNWTHLADELIAHLQEHATEPVVGIGHSMGAVVTFMAACKRPDLFSGVLMLDPPIFWGVAAWTLRARSTDAWSIERPPRSTSAASIPAHLRSAASKCSSTEIVRL